jgi:type IV secretory pathway VirD2 relaxase
MPETARMIMLATKQRFSKDGGIVAYHGYQSFKPSETMPEQTYQIGIELAERLWDKRFECIVATHLDRGHLHNHLLVNSVSFADDKRFRNNKTTYGQLRATSDNLCREHCLSVIERSAHGNARSYAEWRDTRQRQDIAQRSHPRRPRLGDGPFT